jgi:hypothetical protein
METVKAGQRHFAGDLVDYGSLPVSHFVRVRRVVAIPPVQFIQPLQDQRSEFLAGHGNLPHKYSL